MIIGPVLAAARKLAMLSQNQRPPLSKSNMPLPVYGWPTVAESTHSQNRFKPRTSFSIQGREIPENPGGNGNQDFSRDNPAPAPEPETPTLELRPEEPTQGGQSGTLPRS